MSRHPKLSSAIMFASATSLLFQASCGDNGQDATSAAGGTSSVGGNVTLGGDTSGAGAATTLGGTGSGSVAATGGDTSTGGMGPTGGNSELAGSGGTQNTGGVAVSAGGAVNSGGSIAVTGGTSSLGGSGGATNTGGMSNSGGVTDLTVGAGGTGGAATGGSSASAVVGCTGSLTGPDESVYSARKPSSSNRYLPLSVGAHWGWQETDATTGTTEKKQSWVEAIEQLTGTKAGINAYRVGSTTLTGGTLNWQQDTGSAVVRQRSQFLDLTGAIKSSDEMVPNQIRLDETASHLTQGTQWTETYTDTKTRSTGTVVTATINVTWTVEAIDEVVTVPAGTFSCLRVHRAETPSSIDTSGGDNVYWFARGVGKVKQTGPVYHELLGYCYP